MNKPCLLWALALWCSVINLAWAQGSECTTVLQQADQQYHNGRLTEVIEQLWDCAHSEQMPPQDQAEALRLIALSQYRLGLTRPALTTVMDLLRVHPAYAPRFNDSEALQRAVAELAPGNERATALRTPENPECLGKLHLADRHYRKGRLTDVIQTLEGCPTDTSLARQDRVEALRLIALSQYRLGLKPQAKETLARLINVQQYYAPRYNDPEGFRSLYAELWETELTNDTIENHPTAHQWPTIRGLDTAQTKRPYQISVSAFGGYSNLTQYNKGVARYGIEAGSNLWYSVSLSNPKLSHGWWFETGLGFLFTYWTADDPDGPSAYPLPGICVPVVFRWQPTDRLFAAIGTNLRGSWNTEAFGAGNTRIVTPSLQLRAGIRLSNNELTSTRTDLISYFDAPLRSLTRPSSQDLPNLRYISAGLGLRYYFTPK